MPPKKPEPEAPSFEIALGRLETIVGEMDSGKLPLEDLLRRYEEGIALVKICGQHLDTAELRMKKIARDAGGKLVVGDDEASLAPEANVVSAKDDVSLF